MSTKLIREDQVGVATPASKKSIVNFSYYPISRMRPMEIWAYECSPREAKAIVTSQDVLIVLHDKTGAESIFTFSVVPKKSEVKDEQMHIGVHVDGFDSKRTFEHLLNFHKESGKSALRLVTEQPEAKRLCCQ